MQPIADLAFLQFTEKLVKLGQRAFVIGIRRNSRVLIQAGGRCQAQYLPPQMRQTPGVHPCGIVIFIDQRFQIPQRPIAFRAGQRRGQVIDDHRSGAALGLGAFAGIVDDKGIGMGQWPQHRLGPAGFRQGKRLAREPFQIAMFAHMHDCIGGKALAQPGIEGQVIMRRHQIRGVIGAFGVDVIAPRRLHTDNQIAKFQDRQGKMPAIFSIP